MFDYQVKLDRKNRIRLPEDVLQHYDISPGDRLDIIERPDGVLEIRAALSDSASVDELNLLEQSLGEQEIRIKNQQDSGIEA